MKFDVKNVRCGAAAAAIVAFVAIIPASVPARAGNVATRCGYDGCEAIHCNYSGNRCHRVDGDYDRVGYRGDDDDRDDGYSHLVCDSDGDRCYRTQEGYWNYREYYRRHGYHWNHRADRYYDRGYGSDRLNREEYDRAREADRDDDDRY